MDEELLRRVQQRSAELADRGFGDVTLLSGRTLARFSNASSTAADNLLAKAADALTDGDQPRARRLVERAVRIPFDDREEMVPAAWSAHMMLYMLVADAVEDTEPDDMSWLAACEMYLAALDPVRAAQRASAGYGLDTMLYDEDGLPT